MIIPLEAEDPLPWCPPGSTATTAAGVAFIALL